jgi:hypothetical protein
MSEHVILHSHVSNKKHSHDNQIFNFITELNTPLVCEGNWEVALLELIYPRLLGNETVYAFAYIDCVEFTYVGSHQYSIIRPLLLQNSDPSTVVNVDNYVKPYYLPVCKSRIGSISLQIEPDLDFEANPYSLNSGDVSAHIHFKEIKPTNDK